MNHTVRSVLGAVIVLLSARFCHANPNWTKTGDCMSCHTATLTRPIHVAGHYTRANPTEAVGVADAGRLKVFWIKPGEIKPLSSFVNNLNPYDRYGIMLKGFGNKGVQTNTTILSYTADCAWSQWWSGTAGFFGTPPTDTLAVTHHTWPAGQQNFDFSIGVNTACPSDYYLLTVAVAGAPESGNAFFYGEESFYLYVGNTSPTIVATADFNCDNHVDATDFDFYSACYNGPVNAVSGNCLQADFDENGYVDATDFDVFSACYNGPVNPPRNGCTP